MFRKRDIEQFGVGGSYAYISGRVSFTYLGDKSKIPWKGESRGTSRNRGWL